MAEDAYPGLCEGLQFTRPAEGQIMPGVDDTSLRACSNRHDEEEKTAGKREEHREERILFNKPGKSS